MDEDKGSQVPGILWLISKGDEVILDGYEGLKFGWYYKKIVTVCLNGESVQALVYLMPETQEEGRPFQWYLERTHSAYERFGLDTNQLLKMANRMD